MKYISKGLIKDPNVKNKHFFVKKQNEPVYTGFPLIKETETDGFTYGAISNYLEPDNKEGCVYGDGFVQAPDGSRAGLVWGVYEDKRFITLIEPNEERWGVYEVDFPKPIKTINDLIFNFRSILPVLKEKFNNKKI